MLVGACEGKTSLGWEENIIMGPRKIGWDCVDWVHVVQDCVCGGLL
jgi:hypothetical protein